MDQAPAQPVLPGLEILVGPQLRERGQVVGLADHQFGGLFVGDAQPGEPAGPVEAGRLVHQLGEGAQVVGQVGVAALDHIPVRGGDLGLQRDDARGGARMIVGRAAERQREHGRDVAGIGGQDLGMLLVAEIRLVGQADAGLAQMKQVAAGVLGVGVDVHAGPAADAGALQRRQHRGQLVGGGGRVDHGQFLPQGGEPAFAHGLLVHEAGVQVADALLVGFRCRRRGGFGT